MLWLSALDVMPWVWQPHWAQFTPRVIDTRCHWSIMWRPAPCPRHRLSFVARVSVAMSPVPRCHQWVSPGSRVVEASSARHSHGASEARPGTAHWPGYTGHRGWWVECDQRPVSGPGWHRVMARLSPPSPHPSLAGGLSSHSPLGWGGQSPAKLLQSAGPALAGAEHWAVSQGSASSVSHMWLVIASAAQCPDHTHSHDPATGITLVTVTPMWHITGSWTGVTRMSRGTWHSLTSWCLQQSDSGTEQS